MKPTLFAALACIAALAGPPCGAQPAAPATAAAGTAEPKVQRTVIEDDGARIDELRVRGHTQTILVSPKRGGTAPYEIITGDGSRDLGDGANTSRGAAGKRVWNVLKF
jgi:poly(3-hydroxybutyrate) depolymerase